MIDYAAWHSGPPPSLGWWPVQTDFVRWFSLEFGWSIPFHKTHDPRNIPPKRLPMAGISQDNIYWRHRPADWSERSRT